MQVDFLWGAYPRGGERKVKNRIDHLEKISPARGAWRRGIGGEKLERGEKRASIAWIRGAEQAKWSRKRSAHGRDSLVECG